MQYRVEQWVEGGWSLIAVRQEYWLASLDLNYLLSNRLCCRLLRSDVQGFTRVVEAHF